MPERKVNIKDLPVYDKSPFRERLKSWDHLKPVRAQRKEKKLVVDAEENTYEIMVGVGECDYYWLDNEPFCKVYSVAHKVLSDLRKPANKFFWCISSRMKKDSDTVRIDFEAFSEFSGIKSKSSYYEAIMDLTRLNIIAIAAMPLFFVNPMMMFNGDRGRLVSNAEREFHERAKMDRGLIR